MLGVPFGCYGRGRVRISSTSHRAISRMETGGKTQKKIRIAPIRQPSVSPFKIRAVPGGGRGTSGGGDMGGRGDMGGLFFISYL